MSKEKKLQIRNSTAEFLVFTSQAGEKGIEVRVEDETVWLTQKLIAVLFGVTVPTVNEHLKNLFSDGEIQENSVIRKFRTTAADGKQYLTAFYNLDAIIAVGFRVNSARAIQFRQWATGILRDFAIRGYVLDKERLKNGAFLSREYYENLLAEIREIRASERKFYQKITDIYATAMDFQRQRRCVPKPRVGARNERLPWETVPICSQPQRGCGTTGESRRNPGGVETVTGIAPKVARASQPWAGGRNPVGIGRVDEHLKKMGAVWK